MPTQHVDVSVNHLYPADRAALHNVYIWKHIKKSKTPPAQRMGFDSDQYLRFRAASAFFLRFTLGFS